MTMYLAVEICSVLLHTRLLALTLSVVYGGELGLY